MPLSNGIGQIEMEVRCLPGADKVVQDSEARKLHGHLSINVAGVWYCM
ncbi:hypothetical protein REC12_08375 [Desulfosporosinus sp. PR]|nr:hypothetical protein [Desulfosporosinus sp. PR]